MKTISKPIIIISRNSPLALVQANLVKDQLLRHYPELRIEIVGRSTTGDRITDRPLYDIGGKDLFVKDLQQAVLNRDADLAVHSLKDLSTTDHPELSLAAIMKREDARDVLISSNATSLSALPQGAVIGTSSPRRHSQLKALRKDLTIHLLRGNIDTRLQQINTKKYDAIILAAAGLNRLNKTSSITEYFDPTVFIPAIGQGALGIECRSSDVQTQQLLKPLEDPITRFAVTAERAVNRRLNGDCHSALGAYATVVKGIIYLQAMVGSLDGTTIIRKKLSGDAHDAAQIGYQLGDLLLHEGANTLLANNDYGK